MLRRLARLLPLAAIVVLTPIAGRAQVRMGGPGQGPPPRPVSDAALSERLQTYFSRAEAYGFSGAVLVAHGDHIVWQGAFGYADRAHGVRNTLETAFDLGSIVKHFTGAAVATLIADGRLHATDSLGQFFPGVPRDKAGITLMQLGNHTSGIAPGTFVNFSDLPQTLDGQIRLILDAPLAFAPGTDQGYSNYGFVLLAAIIEKVTGMPYERFVASTIFGPAGMPHTGARELRREGLTIAHDYTDTDNGDLFDRRQARDRFGTYGNGFMVSTVGDMYRWHQALNGTTVLSDAARQTFFTPGGTRRDYAWGFDQLDTPRGHLMGHNGGSTFGNGAEFQRWTTAGYMTMVFTNATIRGVMGMDAVKRALESMVFGDTVPSAPRVAAAPARLHDGLAGRYLLSSGDTVIIVRDSAGLGVAGQPETGHLLFAGGIQPAQADRARGTAAALAAIVAAGATDSAAAARVIPGFPVMRFLGNQRRENTARPELGAVRGFEVLGAEPSPSGDIKVTVRFHHEHGDEYRAWGFGPDGFGGMMPMLGTPYVALRPVGGDTLASYDLMRGRLARIIPRRAADGRLDAITVLAGGQVLEGRRIGDR